MFKYGKKAGYMGIALLVLAVLPLVVAAFVIPNIGPEVATKFNAAGEVTRWGKSYELLALPVLNLLLSVATYFTAGRQAKNNEDSAAMARIEGMMDKVVEGFEKQLDQLFQGDAMDITTDVEVLERMLAKDGLSSGQGMTLGL